MPLFSSIDSLTEKQQERLEASWAGTFYREVFMRIDESIFAILYSDEPSRPNVPINVLVSLDTLKSGLGWTDEQMHDHFCFDVQVRYALGEGDFTLRTIYKFRDRVTRHMQETGENLIETAFEQTDSPTDKSRMSNLRPLSWRAASCVWIAPRLAATSRL